MGKWIRKLLIFTATSLLFLELLFRFIFPATEVPSSVQIDGGFLVSDADYQQSGHTSVGRLPTDGNHWNINNDNWNSIFTYKPIHERQRPLIALIGDSSVEGHACDVEHHVDTWMFRMLEGAIDVYAFGRGGMPLIQMILLAERVDSLYRPDLFVFMVGHEVVHGSLVPSATVEFHYIVPAPALGTFLVMEPSERQPSSFARIAMQSALVRYIRIHLQTDLFPLMEISARVPNLNARLTDAWINQLLPLAARFMLSRISHTLGHRHLLVVADNWVCRYRFYGNIDVPMSTMNQTIADMAVLRDACHDFHSIEYLSTDEDFQRAWDSTGTYFDSADGRHLNAYGNYATAASILRDLTNRGIIRDIQSSWEDGDPLCTARQDETPLDPARP